MRRYRCLVIGFAVAAALATATRSGAEPADGATPEHAHTTTRGPVTATVQLSPQAPRIGDALELTLQVTAEPGVELLMPEFGQSLERFPIVDFTPRERIDDTGRTIASQVYTLQTRFSGEAAIPPLLIEFVDRREGSKPAPEGEDAYELLTERIPFEIASVVPSDASAELNPPLETLEPLRETRDVVTAITVAIALAALVGWLAWYYVIVPRRGRARRISAYATALARLDALTSRPVPDGEEAGALLVELSDIIRHYLEDRFELRAPELTTEEFLVVAAGSPDLSDEHRSFLRDFLEHADRVKFARFVPGREHVTESLIRARRFLEQTRDEDAVVEPGLEHAHA
jgi:hypothetical protein